MGSGRVVLLALVMSVSASAGAIAQDPAAPVNPVFDLGLYAGGAYHSDWFQDSADDGWGVGTAPIFGAQATYWTSPTFGVRLNGAYLPMHLPEGEGASLDQYDLSSFLYDLDLVFRPWIAAAGDRDVLGSTYLFLGAGAVSVGLGDNVPRTGADDCANVAPYLAENVCVKDATKVQGTLGLGLTLTGLGSRASLFGELGTRAYDTPVDVGPGGGATGNLVISPFATLGVRASPGGLLPLEGADSLLPVSNLRLGLGAGLSRGFGNLGDFTSVGVNVGGVAEADSLLGPLGIRGQLGFQRLFGRDDGNSIDVFSGTINGTYSVYRPRFVVGLGGGLFRDRAACDGCPAQTELGFQAFAGVPGPLPNLRIEVGVDSFGGNEIGKVAALLFLD